MIVCKKCGNQNPDGETFCTSCHSFLEWAGEKVVEAPPPPPPPAPAPEPKPAFVERVKQAVGIDDAKVEAPASPPSDGAAATVPAQSNPEPAAGAVPSPVTSSMSGTASAAAAATPAAHVPAAVLPQAVAPAPERVRQAPKTDTVTGQRYKPGDLICGQCGAGNSSDRHFCQKCGANLSAAVVVTTPWYRNLFRARSAPAAGTRPRSAPVERAYGAALFRVIAAGIVVAVVLAYVAVPPLRAKVNGTVGSVYAAAHRHFAGHGVPVRASSANASSELSTHPTRLSIDLVKDTYWAANTSTDKQPWIRLSFGGTVDLDGILLTSGAGKDFATLARPKDVQIVFSDKSSTRLTLKDDPNPTQYDFSSHVVSSFAEIHILSVYPSAQSPDVAIAEVEFFKIE